MGSATAITHVWKDNKVITRLKAYANNVTPLEAELMAIYIGLILAFETWMHTKLLLSQTHLK